MKRKTTLLLSLVLLFSSFSAFAGVIDPAPAAVAVSANYTTSLQIGSDLSAWYSDLASQTFTINNTKIENTKVTSTGYLEYKLTAATAGDYSVTITSSTKSGTATFNVDTYAEGNAFVLDAAKTQVVTNLNDWNKYTNHTFSITLPANTTTIMRVSLMNTNYYVCNITGITIDRITDTPIAPTVSVPAAIQLATDLNSSYSDDAAANFTISDALIENTQVATSGYLEYKIKATKTRDYTVTVSAATQQNGASMNVDVFTGGDVFVLDPAKTQAITNAGAGVFSNYTFTLSLTENIAKVLRVTLMNTNNTVCNINGITVAEVIPVITVPAALQLKDDMAANVNVTEIANTGLGGVNASGYAEYHIKSATAGTHTVTILAATNKTDVTLNVGTYDIGGAFVINDAQTKSIANSGSFTADQSYVYAITLAANTTQVLRLTFAAAGWTCNIHGISIAVGTTTANSINKADNLIIYTANGVLNIENAKEFANGTVELFDITGKQIATQKIIGTNCQMTLNNKGMYIARVMDANNIIVKTTKIIVE